MKTLIRSFLRLFESYLLVMSLALILGFAFPQYLKNLAPLAAFLLQTIFFITGLKIDLKEVARHARHPVRLFLAMIVMLILYPLIAYPVTKFFVPEAAVGIFLLAAMPTAMSAPLFASLAGGSVELALVLTVLTSALAPFTIPLVTAIVLGNGVALSSTTMLTDLVLITFPPLLLAQGARVLFHTKIEAASFTLKPLSILLLGLIMAGVVGSHASELSKSLTPALLPVIGALVIFILLTHIIGYVVAFHRSHKEKVSYAIALAYMNIVLAIYVAGRFFPDPQTILTTVTALLFWTVVFAPFRVWALRTQ